jgi:hypothetical protein
MPAVVPGGPRYRFGPFELNTLEESLARNGACVKVQEPPYRVLKPALPLDVVELCDKGLLAVGEIGLVDPDIPFEQFKDGSRTVPLSSGLLCFLHAVACIVHTRAGVRRVDGISGEASVGGRA